MELAAAAPTMAIAAGATWCSAARAGERALLPVQLLEADIQAMDKIMRTGSVVRGGDNRRVVDMVLRHTSAELLEAGITALVGEMHMENTAAAHECVYLLEELAWGNVFLLRWAAHLMQTGACFACVSAHTPHLLFLPQQSPK